jgi:hypothetical protein
MKEDTTGDIIMLNKYENLILITDGTFLIKIKDGQSYNLFKMIASLVWNLMEEDPTKEVLFNLIKESIESGIKLSKTNQKPYEKTTN